MAAVDRILSGCIPCYGMMKKAMPGPEKKSRNPLAVLRNRNRRYRQIGCLVSIPAILPPLSFLLCFLFLPILP